MNEQDKEAFEKWCMSYFGHVTSAPSIDYAWQAALEYERERSKKLVVHLEILIEVRLEAINKEGLTAKHSWVITGNALEKIKGVL